VNIEARIRPLDPADDDEVECVAARMQQTLIEVLGEQEGGQMYDMPWLLARVRWHLDPEQVIGEIFVAEQPEGDIVGHTIVRIDVDDEGAGIGLFSTVFVTPAARRGGVAGALIRRGEEWVQGHGLSRAATYTARNNAPLRRLFIAHGYTLTPMDEVFVMLSKALG
jgi:GNAT superfamily N-acetyltransferase